MKTHKINHTKETRPLKRNASLVKIALFSFVAEEFLRLPRVALQFRCSFLGVRSTIQFHVFNSDWHKFLETAVWCLVFARPYFHIFQTSRLMAPRFSSSSRKQFARNVYIKFVGIIIYDLPLQEISCVKQIPTTNCIKLTHF